MAYIPPHKRPLSEDTDRPLPTAYPELDVHRWLIIGLNEDNQFPSSVHFDKLISLEYKEGEENLVLVNSRLNNENDQERENILRSPWVSIAENVQLDLISSFENVRKVMECQEIEKVKPTLVARFGKIIFHRRPSPSLERLKRSHVAETTLRQLNTFFYTHIPTSYVENIIDRVAPIIGVDFEEKERYRVWLHDRIRDKPILCKCRVEHDKKLEPYKVERRHSRYNVVNISCLDKDLDLRLTLSTRRIKTAQTDDEKHCIRDLIRSADLDSSVKGGLRWPLGKDSSGGRFGVFKIEHLIVKYYSSPSLRLKVIYADRYSFHSSRGEVSWEIDLKLKKVLSELQEKVEINTISDTLKDNLRLIWDHFLSYQHRRPQIPKARSFICPEFRHYLNGVELANSISTTHRKWFLTNMDCCCLWIKQPSSLVDSLSTNPEYLRNSASESNAVVDYKDWQIALSRPFRAMKLWVVIRRHGLANLMCHIRSDVSMAKRFEAMMVKDSRFEMVVPRKFALVCFRLKPKRECEGVQFNSKLLAAVNSSGRAFMTHAVLGGLYVTHCAIGTTLTEERHVDNLWKLIQEKAEFVLMQEVALANEEM